MFISVTLISLILILHFMFVILVFDTTSCILLSCVCVLSRWTCVSALMCFFVSCLQFCAAWRPSWPSKPRSWWRTSCLVIPPRLLCHLCCPQISCSSTVQQWPCSTFSTAIYSPRGGTGTTLHFIFTTHLGFADHSYWTPHKTHWVVQFKANIYTAVTTIINPGVHSVSVCKVDFFYDPDCCRKDVIRCVLTLRLHWLDIEAI